MCDLHKVIINMMQTYKSRQPQTRFRQVASPKVFCSLLQSHLLSQTRPEKKVNEF